MKYYPHNVGDWLPATLDLSCAEEGVYRRLMDWYYSNELPLPLAMRDINKIARVRNQGERDAVQLVVTRYFILADDGWHHDTIDKVLKTYAQSAPNRVAKRDAAAERQRRSRQKREASWAALISKGIQVPFKATQTEMDELLYKHGVTQVVTRDVQRDKTSDAQCDPVHARVQNQEPISVTRDRVPLRGREDAAAGVLVVDPSPTESRVGSAAKALRASGFPMPQANTADPRFLALLQAGVSDEEVRLTAAEATARGKGWGWLVATIAGRHADVASGFAPRRAANAPNRRDPERVAGLTPTIASKPPF